MRRCVYCAEEIQDAAVRCRWCGSSLPLVDVLTPADLPDDVEVIEAGRRYALGIVDRSYAVWDLVEPDEPLQTFGGEPGDIDEAEAVYRALERAAAPRFRWRLAAQLAFTAGLMVWAIARGVEVAIFFLERGSLFETGFPTALSLAQSIGAFAFAVWVGSLALLASWWFGEALRRWSIGP